MATTNEFDKMDAEYGNCIEKCYGPTLMSYPCDADACRMLMAAQNFKQFLTQANPDIPRIATGHENIFGRMSAGYKKIIGDWKIIDKITKFGDDSMFTLILYNAVTDTYDMIEKKVAENLSERFGYVYNTDKIDSLSIGDDVLNNDVLFRSTSYDKFMNYRMGKNARTKYTINNDIIEDAVKIRRGFAESCITFEVKTVRVPINDNDILLLLHGDKKDGLRTIPRIGEFIKGGFLCATRRINNNHILYDLQEEQLQNVNATDSMFVTPPGSVIYDINIYYNNQAPFPNNVFFKELNSYYNSICKYYDDIYNWTVKIKSSGSKYTINVQKMKKDSQLFNRPDYKWKDRDKAFNNMIVEFKIKSVSGLKEGYKITGRYGDKGVISKICNNEEYEESHGIRKGTELFKSLSEEIAKAFNIDTSSLGSIDIVDDSNMPYDENGVPIDIELDVSGAIRRLNTGQIYEVDINFASERIRQYICTLPTYDEKLDLIFKYIGMLNQNECQTFIDMYRAEVTVNDEIMVRTNEDFKKVFVDSVEKNGFYLIKPPGANIRYEFIEKIYDEFGPEILKPYQLYIDIFGMKRKPLLQKSIVGDKYIFVLKQTTSKNFSSRSTGKTTKAGLPAKSADKKESRALHSNTPVKNGEAHNLLASIDAVTYAKYNIFLRTSPIGRRELGKIMTAKGNPTTLLTLPILETYLAVNVQTLKAKLKVMGLSYEFVTDETLTEEVLNKYKTFFEVYGMTFLDSPINRTYYVYLINAYNKIVRSGTDRGEIAWKAVMDLPETKIIKISKDILEITKIALFNRDKIINKQVNESVGVCANDG